MDPQFETIELEGNSVIKAFTVKTDVLQQDHGWHYHPECELTYVISGEGTRFVGDSVQHFEAGDLVFCAANLPHCWRNETTDVTPVGSNHLLVLQFRQDCLGEDFLLSPDAQVLKSLFQKAQRGIKFNSEVVAAVAPVLHELVESSGLQRLSLFVNTLDALCSTEDAELLSSELYFGDFEAFHGGRMAKILDYLKENLTEEIKQTDVAELVGMTPQGFSRFFRATTGRTFVSFVNVMRTMEACRLLVSTDSDIIDIAFSCGYANLSNFNRRFAELKQTTPREYRKQHSKLDTL